MARHFQPVKFTWKDTDIFLPTVVIGSDLRRIADAHFKTRVKEGCTGSQSSILHKAWSDEEEENEDLSSHTGPVNTNEPTFGKGIGLENWKNLSENRNFKTELHAYQRKTGNMLAATKSESETGREAREELNDNGLFKRKFQSKEELLRNMVGAKMKNAAVTVLQRCERCGLELIGSVVHQCIDRKKSNEDAVNKQTESVEDEDTDLNAPTIPVSDELKCTDCGKTFTKKIHLVLHTKIHARMTKFTSLNYASKKFACNFCELRFESNDALVSHFQAKHYNNLNDQKHNVNVEAKTTLHKPVFTVKNQLPTQTLSVRKEDGCEQFKCLKCGRTFERQNQLNFHKALCKSQVSKNASNDLSQKQPSSNAQKFGVSVHAPLELKFRCKLCNLAFLKQVGLSQHVAKAHRNSQNKFRCSECGRKFRQKHHLKFHIKSHVKVCNICGVKFDEFGYIEHLKFCVDPKSASTDESTAEKEPVPCEICGKICNGEVELSQHCLIHAFGLDEYVNVESPDFLSKLPFVCHNFACTRRFSHESDLIYHVERKHLTRDPICCEMCGKIYNNESSLMDHRSSEHCLTTQRKKLRIPNLWETSNKETDTQVRSQPTYYYIQDGYPQPPDPHVMLLRDINGPADKLLTKLLSEAKKKPRTKTLSSATPVILTRRRLKRKPGKKPREDIPFQNFYICELCNKRFQKRNLYIIHVNMHKNQDRFKCNVCDKRFHARTLLEQHIKRHDDPNYTGRPGRAGRSDVPFQDVYTCETCNKQFEERNLFIIHLNFHKNRYRFACHLCDKRFHASTLLQQHIKRHDDPNYKGRASRLGIPFQDVYKCSKCPETHQKSFTDRQKFILHMWQHKRKRFQCKFCDRAFVDYNLLLAHLRKHSDPNFVPRAGRGGRLDIPKQDVYYCQQCDDGKSFTDRTKYLIHIRYHNLEEKFPCPHCPRRFKVELTLKAHMTTHSNVKPYKCDGCLKRFKMKQFLTTHQKFCKNIPCKHKCKRCGDMFHNKITLNRHVGRFHSKPEPEVLTPMIEHPCPHCSQTFNTTFGLTRHIAIYHPGTDAPPIIKSEFITYGDNNGGHPPRDMMKVISAAGCEDETTGDPDWAPSPEDGHEEHDVSDMYLTNFCEAQLNEEPDHEQMQQPVSKPTPLKSMTTCNCGKYKKYESQKFCHMARCPCVNAGKACHSRCRCKDGCVNSSNTASDQQKKFQEGRESMFAQDQAELQTAASSYNSITEAPISSARAYPTPVSPKGTPVNDSISSFGQKRVIQSEFISLSHETQDETIRELTLSGYVEGAEDDPLGEADISPTGSPNKSEAPLQLNRDISHEATFKHMPASKERSKSMNITITTSDGSSFNRMPALTHQQSQSLILRCQFCSNKAFRLMSTYISHMLLHDNERSEIKCPLCNSSFESVVTLAQHMDGHNQGQDHNCTRCSSRFKASIDMELHLKVHHFRPMECGICLIKFTDVQTMMRHWSQEHPTCQCGICSFKFFRYEDLNQHMKALHSPYDCLLCSTRYETLGKLLEHFKKTHAISTSTYSRSLNTTHQLLRCDYCGKTFSTVETLNSHLASHLTGHSSSTDSNLKCEECGEILGSIDELNEHLSNHIHGITMTRSNADKSYPTVEQDFSYSRFASEENNMEASESIMCPQCDKGFVNRQSWTTHMRVHNLSLCSSCYATFTSESELRQHFQTSSCKVYKCDKCDKNFKDRRYLHQHAKSHKNLDHVQGSSSLSERESSTGSRANDVYGLQGGFSTPPVIVASQSLATHNNMKYASNIQSSSRGRPASVEEVTLD